MQPARDETPPPDDEPTPPPAKKEPRVRRRTLAERWQAIREGLIPLLWIGFALILAVRVALIGKNPLGAILLFAIPAIIVWALKALRCSRQNAAKEKMLHECFNERKRIVGSFNTNGGSGKTTIICLIATVWAEFSRKDICLIDLNNNSGHAGERLGIRERRTIRVSNVHKQLLDPVALRNLTQELPTTDHRLVVIDREEEVVEKGRLSRLEVREVIHALFGNFHTIMLDNGNDSIGGYEMAAADEVNVALLVANTGKPESLLDVARTIQSFERNGIVDLKNRTIAVLCRPYPWPFQSWNELKGLDPDVPVFHLPWDLHIKLVKLGRPLNFHKLRPRTKEALYNIALAICALAPAVNERLSPDLEAEEWIQKVLENSPFSPPLPETRHKGYPSEPSTT